MQHWGVGRLYVPLFPEHGLTLVLQTHRELTIQPSLMFRSTYN